MLSRRQRELLNTDFGHEMEKQAAEIVEMEKTAEDCYTYGEDLALEKIAEMEEEAAEEKKKEGEGKKESDEEEEKTAAAMGEIITDAYWNTLMEKGAEYYNDPDIYIEKLAKKKSLMQRAKKGYKATMKEGKSFKGNLKKAIMGGKIKGVRGRAAKKLLGSNLARGGGVAAALGAGAYGVHKYRNRKK